MPTAARPAPVARALRGGARRAAAAICRAGGHLGAAAVRRPGGRAAAALLAALAAAVASPAATGSERAAAGSWTRPVPGEIRRGFAYGADPFAAGLHRGVDLAAARGAPVRAPCAGRVAFAGPLPEAAHAVTLRCGPWRVALLPLAAVEVTRGRPVGAGERIARLARTRGSARGHAGLHLGVRAADDPFGYVDPAPFLAPPPPATGPPPLGRVPARPRGRPPHPAPGPLRPRPAPAPAPLRAPPAPASAPLRAPAVAPWPVWAGLALLLAGATGSSVAVRRRGRTRPPAGRRAAARARPAAGRAAAARAGPGAPVA